MTSSAPPPPVSLEAALGLIATLPVCGTRRETVPLAEAAGRILAADAVALCPVPGFNHAAVDGWAVRLADCEPNGETRLLARGRLVAGQDGGGLAVAGAALRIMTGAMLPPGAEAVVMQERVRREGDQVVLPAGLLAGQNIRRKGEHLAAGAVWATAGRCLRAQDLALAAAAGVAGGLSVRAKLRVGVLSTGDEVRPLGTTLPPGTVTDANGIMLAALLAADGADVVGCGCVEDDRFALTETLRHLAMECDLVVTSGGVSVGEEDHLRAALRTTGSLLFWRVAIKPGRPTAVATIGTTPVLALPGNPAAAFTAYHVLGRALVRRLSGLLEPVSSSITACAAWNHGSVPEVCEFVPVRLRAGAPWPLVSPSQGGKGGLTALVAADALARVDPDRPAIRVGDPLPVLPLR